MDKRKGLALPPRDEGVALEIIKHELKRQAVQAAEIEAMRLKEAAEIEAMRLKADKMTGVEINRTDPLGNAIDKAVRSLRG